MSVSANEINELNHAPRVEGVLPVFHERWSPRAFTDRQISDGDLTKIFEAARWAPSSFNEQPWRFIVGRKGTPTFDKIRSSLGEFNLSWAPGAPILILGIAKKTFCHNNTPNGFAIYDLGAAAGFITLEAAALGIATHQMAGFDKETARKALDIPDDFDIGSVMAIGYQGDPETLSNDKMKEQERSPRNRKSLNEIVLSSWGEPAKLG
jgi:nitroreductase